MDAASLTPAVLPHAFPALGPRHVTYPWATADVPYTLQALFLMFN